MDTGNQLLSITFDQPLSSGLSSGNGCTCTSAGDGRFGGSNTDSVTGNVITMNVSPLGAGTGPGTCAYDGTAGGIVGASGIQVPAFSGLICSFV